MGDAHQLALTGRLDALLERINSGEVGVDVPKSGGPYNMW